MTSATKSIAVILLILTAYVAMPSGAEAALTPEQQAQLQARVRAYYESLNRPSTPVQTTRPSQECGVIYAWNRNLAVGMTGYDVQVLQRVLNRDTITLVAVTGPGSRGQETTYFGAATSAALRNFQAKYKLPQTGIFDTATRLRMNDLCKAQVSTPPSTNPGNGGGTTPPTNGDEDKPAQKPEQEANVTNYRAMSSPSGEEVQAGDEKIDVFGFEFTLNDAAASVGRVEVAFQATGDTILVKEPWRQIGRVSLWYDGEEVAYRTTSSKDAWNKINSTTYSMRFSNIKVDLEEGEKPEFIVAITPLRSIDSNRTPQKWNVWIPTTGVRIRDAAGVMSYTGDQTKSKTFTIIRAGSNERLRIKTADSNPDEATVRVRSTSRTQKVPLLAFTIRAEGGVIRLKSLPLTVSLDDVAYADVVQRLYIGIGNSTYTDVSIADPSGTETEAVFSFDRDLVLSENSDTQVTVYADLRNLSGNYPEGTEISASLSGEQIDMIEAEGKRDIPAERLGGSAYGHQQVLRTFGVQTRARSTSAIARSIQSNTEDIGDYQIVVDVTAFGEAMYIPKGVARLSFDADTILSGASAPGFGYTLIRNGEIAVDGVTVSSVASTAKTQEGAYVVQEGATERFTISVSYNPDTVGSYYLNVEDIRFRKSQQEDADADREYLSSSAYQTKSVSLVQ